MVGFLTLALKHSIVPNNIMTIEYNNIVLRYYNIHKKEKPGRIIYIRVTRLIIDINVFGCCLDFYASLFNGDC